MNLGPFQPVEFVKILLVLFLAGYFTRHWERLRDLREKRVFPRFFGRIGLPRLEHVVPVLCAVAISLVFFFVLKDLGPALVTFFVFLAMFAVARGRPGLALAGLDPDGRLRSRSAIAWDSRTRWWTASTCGSRRGTTTFTAATSSRTRSGRSPPAARPAPAPAGATPP